MSTRVQNSKVHMKVHSCRHQDAYEQRHNTYVFFKCNNMYAYFSVDSDSTQTRLGLDVDQQGLDSDLTRMSSGLGLGLDSDFFLMTWT